MTTEYFDDSNSLCSSTFESVNRRRLISDDYKNSDLDCENLMDFSGDNFQSEISAKASSSSIHESITNMSNSHSTPEDTFSEITTSPGSKHCKPDSDIKDYEHSAEQYLIKANINSGFNQSARELIKPLQTILNNHKSIDDTIELVLSKIREENNFSKNMEISESCFKEQSESFNFLNLSEFSNSASNLNVQNIHGISTNHVPCIVTGSHSSESLSYSKGITSNAFQNSNICNYSTPNYSKSYPQHFYNYGITSQVAANFNNSIHTPSYSEYNKLDYSRSNYMKENDKGKYTFYPYQCPNPQFRQYLPHSYLNQQFYKSTDPQYMPIRNSNLQMFPKTTIKRNAYFDQMYIDDDNIYKDNSKNQNYNIYFKTPQSNTSGIIDQNSSIRKKRTNTDPTKLTPNKKRKLTNQISVSSTYDELLRKLKVLNYNSLLMNPPILQSLIILSPKGFSENSKSSTVKKSFQYKKYRSALFQINKPKDFQDSIQEDNYLSQYVNEDITENDMWAPQKDKEFEEFSDIICDSPINLNTIQENVDSPHLSHLSTDFANLDPKSPELIHSFKRNSKTFSKKEPVESKVVLGLNNCIKNHSITPILTYTDNETKLITELHSHKSQELSRNYIQLSGSFLKRTKINGKSFSNIHIEEAVSIASLSASKNQNCCYFCYAFLNGIPCLRKSSKLFGIESLPEDLLFCSASCYSNFKSCNSLDCNENRKVLNNHSTLTNSTTNFQCTKILIKTTPFKPTKNHKKVCDFEQYVRRRFPSEGQSDVPHKPPALSVGVDTSLPTAKMHRLGLNYSYFKPEKTQKSICKQLDKLDQNLLLSKYSCSYRAPDLIDRRSCILCHITGDGDESVSGRLININADQWVHLNCALWCYDVFETVSGYLMEFNSSLEKALKTMCSHCQKYGAGIQCYRNKCSSVYHVPCAYKLGCVFYTDRGMYCPHHVVLNHPMHLPVLRVDRRVTLMRDETALITAGIVADQDPDHDVKITLRTGSLILHTIGQLLPDQLVSGYFNTNSIIYPVGYHTTRIYWSSTELNRRCKYDCVISERDGHPWFTVAYETEQSGRSVLEHSSCDHVWKLLLQRIARLRHQTCRTRLFPSYLSGEQLYGLTEPHIVRVIESLPGLEMLTNYAFKFGKMQLITEMPLAINPSGSARTEPKLRTYIRRGRDHRSAVDSAIAMTTVSNHCNLTNTAYAVLKAKPIFYQQLSGIGYDSSMLVGGNSNSKAHQYKRLKSEWRNNVVLSRSRIQGLGLFAGRDFDKSTMIIEYIGELIRNEVGNAREKLYEARNNSIYMFRLSEDLIIDATVHGGLARYINHSCSPNCVAETLSLDCGSRIIITTRRAIERGEELTYDYKFDFEDNKAARIPCLCGSTNCRKWMN